MYLDEMPRYEGKIMKKCIYYISIFLMITVILMLNVSFVFATGGCTEGFEHSWRDWYTVSYPTCTEDGEKERYCRYCNAVETEIIEAEGHEWDSWYNYTEQEWVIDPEVDTEKYNLECHGALLKRECLKCSKNDEKRIDAKGCIPNAVVSQNGRVFAPKCERCGNYVYKGYNNSLMCYHDVEIGDEYRKCYMKVFLSTSVYFDNGETHKPSVSVYIYTYDNSKYVGKKEVPSSYYTVKYSGDGLSEGTYTAQVDFKELYSGSITKSYSVTANPLGKAKLDMYKGKSYALSLPDTGKEIIWKSSNSKVATVSKSGKVTARGYGSCTITAVNKGKVYSSKVTVPHHKLIMHGEIMNYSTRYNIISIYVKNKGNVPLTLYSKDVKLIDLDYKSYDRDLKLTGGKNSITIKPGRDAYIKFKVIGAITWPGIEDKKVRLKLKYDGKNYTRYVYS